MSMTKRWLLSLCAAFLCGWLVNGWYQDSLDLVAAKAAQNAQERATAHEFNQAVALDAWLANNTIQKETIRLETVKLVDRPVYRNVCLDDDGLRLANAAKNGTAVQPSAGVRNPAGHHGDDRQGGAGGADGVGDGVQ
ncbi:hypothetical protein DDSR119_26 [Pseudomonas phage DDSR119]|nr:hypothetical protein DDSR119_26 [Pseudomonas phage DDSR119]